MPWLFIVCQKEPTICDCHAACSTLETCCRNNFLLYAAKWGNLSFPRNHASSQKVRVALNHTQTCRSVMLLANKKNRLVDDYCLWLRFHTVYSTHKIDNLSLITLLTPHLCGTKLILEHNSGIHFDWLRMFSCKVCQSERMCFGLLPPPVLMENY